MFKHLKTAKSYYIIRGFKILENLVFKAGHDGLAPCFTTHFEIDST